VQHHLQTYTEPSLEPTANAPVTATSSTVDNTILPLREGTLTHNSGGVPIVVVCTKADLIDHEADIVHGGPNIMIKGKTGEWEERTDSIMQVLRTISLKCKADMQTKLMF
jgi:dynein light intermediate chain 1, cytosolic